MTPSSNWRRRALTVAAGLAQLCDRLGAKRLARSLQLSIVERAWAGLVQHEEVTDLLGALQGRDRLRFLHVLGCVRCSREARSSLSESLTSQIDQHDLDGARTGAWHLEMGRRYMAGLIFLADQLPDRARAPQASSRPSAGVAALLAAAEQLADPARGEELAVRALETVATDKSLGFEEALALRLGALSLLMLFRLRQGRLAQAETTYEEALSALEAEEALSGLRASLLAGLGQLRWTQLRRDEAAALLAAAGWIFQFVRENQAAAACHLQAGFALLEEVDPARARAHFVIGGSALDGERAPALMTRALYGSAYCRAALDSPAQAPETPARDRPADDPDPDAGEEAFRRWWEGKISTCQHDYHAADGELETARRRLLAAGSLAEAARCSLDLLVVRLAARYGGSGQAAGLGEALIEAFGPEPAVARCAERLESAARLAARGSPRLEANLWSTRSSFARLPPDQCRPDLIRSVQSLADPLLVDPLRRLTSMETGS
jgi:hypothetical protein